MLSACWQVILIHALSNDLQAGRIIHNRQQPGSNVTPCQRHSNGGNGHRRSYGKHCAAWQRALLPCCISAAHAAYRQHMLYIGSTCCISAAQPPRTVLHCQQQGLYHFYCREGLVMNLPGETPLPLLAC
jgi:hypothetical protein